MTKQYLCLPILILLAGPLLAGQRANVKRAQVPPPGPELLKNEVGALDAEAHARVVHYHQQDVVPVKAKVRYTTLIVLPKNESILDFTCGDKEYWVVSGTQNLAYVKPAKAGSRTNLNLITASGNIYSFLLAEVSEAQDSPDLKVFVETEDQTMLSALEAPPKFVSAEVAEDYRSQVEIAKAETRQVKESAQAQVDRGISQFVSNVRFPYHFEAGKKPFGVRAMYTDDKFMYIQARPEETPALYEIKDGKPNLVNFEYKNGVYMVPKILDEGYLAIGKQKLHFKREL
jgi:type IV secretion system protein VirB9